MAKEISDEYREELHEAFLMFDKNRDGSISVQELAQILQNLNQGATVDEINEMIKQVDVDGDGEIGIVLRSSHELTCRL